MHGCITIAMARVGLLFLIYAAICTFCVPLHFVSLESGLVSLLWDV